MIVEKFKEYSLIQNISGPVSVPAFTTVGPTQLTVAKDKGPVVKMALRIDTDDVPTASLFFVSVFVNNVQKLQDVPATQFIAKNQDATCEPPIRIKPGDTISYVFKNTYGNPITADLLLFYDIDGNR